MPRARAAQSAGPSRNGSLEEPQEPPAEYGAK